MFSVQENILYPSPNRC